MRCVRAPSIVPSPDVGLQPTILSKFKNSKNETPLHRFRRYVGKFIPLNLERDSETVFADALKAIQALEHDPDASHPARGEFFSLRLERERERERKLKHARGREERGFLERRLPKKLTRAAYLTKRVSLDSRSIGQLPTTGGHLHVLRVVGAARRAALGGDGAAGARGRRGGHCAREAPDASRDGRRGPAVARLSHDGVSTVSIESFGRWVFGSLRLCVWALER